MNQLCSVHLAMNNLLFNRYLLFNLNRSLTFLFNLNRSLTFLFNRYLARVMSSSTTYLARVRSSSTTFLSVTLFLRVNEGSISGSIKAFLGRIHPSKHGRHRTQK